MSKTFADFTSITTPIDADQLVGYRTAVAGGERRISLAALKAYVGGDATVTAADITDSSASGRAVLTGTPAEGRIALSAAAAIPEDEFDGLVNVSCFGDSLTEGSGGTPYPTQLATLSGCNVINGGIGGNTSAQIAERYLAASSQHDNSLIVWAGRNDMGGAATPEQIVSSVQSMVTAAGHERYMVFGVISGAGDDSTVLAKIAATNALLASTFPQHYFDVLAYFLGAALADAGITPDTQSTNDIAAGIVPHQLRVDTLHLNTTGYGLVSSQAYQRFDAMFYGGAVNAAPSLKSLLASGARPVRATYVTIGSAASRISQAGDGSSMVFSAKLIPESDGATDLGWSSSMYRWRNLFLSGQLVAGSLAVGNSASASTLGGVVKKIEVFDASGTSLGFVPVYSSIT